jgi:quercetin dioxygenase-like cupin family protein
VHEHRTFVLAHVCHGLAHGPVAGEEIIVKEGEVLHIPSGTPHQAEALEDTFELDVFSPIRTDWLEAEPVR